MEIADKVKKSGVLYLSRVPTFMQPSQLRSLLAARGWKIGRVYLRPESAEQRSRRKKTGSTSGRTKFIEGWVEFERKKDAKLAAQQLNCNPVGGKRGSPWRDDLWNCKYLSGFKWVHLQQEAAYKRAYADELVRLEMAQAKRENEQYLKKVGKAREAAQIGKRKRKQGKPEKEVERATLAPQKKVHVAK